jgi:hypothetical protein
MGLTRRHDAWPHRGYRGAQFHGPMASGSCGDLRRSDAHRGSEARRHHPIRTRRQANRAAPDSQIKKLVKDPGPHRGCAHQMVVVSRAMSRHLEGGNRTRGRPLTGMGRETPPETCLTAARPEVRIRPPALVLENWRLLAAPTLLNLLRRPHPRVPSRTNVAETGTHQKTGARDAATAAAREVDGQR